MFLIFCVLNTQMSNKSFIFLVCWIRVVIRVIIAIPFLTLLERKVLRYMQIRKGPKKASIIGLLQPIADGVKLVIKNYRKPFLANKFIFSLAPGFLFLLMISLWMIIPPFYSFLFFNLSLVFFLVLSRLHVYALFFRG